jgi:prohibitin 1
MHFVIPFWQWPIFVSTRIQPKTMRTQTQTKDMQTINIGLRVLYRPDLDNLAQLIKQYGADYAERFLPSIGNEVMKAVVAKYDAVELITQRAQVSQEIRDRLKERAGHYFLKLNDVAITDLSFSPEFTSAIERKQIAQQEAEKAKYVVQKTEQERLAVVIRAEGEAEAARLISEATASAGDALIELRRIEAARDVATALAQSDKITYIPSNGGNILLNMGRN